MRTDYRDTSPIDPPLDWRRRSHQERGEGRPTSDALRTGTAGTGYPVGQLTQGPGRDWAAFLDTGLSEAEHAAIRAGERTGRPLGSDAFVAGLEQRLGRVLARQKPGRKPKPKGG